MAHKVANGWIAPKPDSCELTAIDEKTGKRVRSTGLFLHTDFVSTVYFNFAGLPEGSTAEDFRLPAHAEFLREVAEAIQLAATDIDKFRGK